MSEDGGGGRGRSKLSWGFGEIGLSREPIFSYGRFIWIIWIWWTLTCSSDQGIIVKEDISLHVEYDGIDAMGFGMASTLLREKFIVCGFDVRCMRSDCFFCLWFLMHINEFMKNEWVKWKWGFLLRLIYNVLIKKRRIFISSYYLCMQIKHHFILKQGSFVPSSFI